MAMKLVANSCALRLSVFIVAILTLHAFATNSAARPLVDKTVHDDVMTSAEMQKRYIRPDGAAEAEIDGAVGGGESEHRGGIVWNRGGWNEKGGWDEGGNWDKGGGWSNRPPWAKPVAIGKQ